MRKSRIGMSNVSIFKINTLFLFAIFFIVFGVKFVLAVSWIGDNITYTSFEDTVYNHNLSNNITDFAADMQFSIDTVNTKIFWNDAEINLSQISGWISITNSTTGNLRINATNNNQTGRFKIPIKVTWNNGQQASTTSFNFTVNATNDAPVFVGLSNQSLNASELFVYNVNVTDEENNIPFIFNVSFLSCGVSSWSNRNCSTSSGRQLFNSSQYTFNQTSGTLIINFTPTKNDVGSYIINFSVTDNSSLGNKTGSQIINFTVNNLNSAPYFTYTCNNERSANEDSLFTCLINASDTDEDTQLSFNSNYAWFLFNGSANSFNVNFNVSSNYNFSAPIRFTPTDVNVGNWSINITLTDIGTGIGAPKSNSTSFWFFVNNTEDSVSLDSISDLTLYENRTFYVNATDEDLLVTQKSVKNEILTFASNTSWVSVSSYLTAGSSTEARIIINYDYGFVNLGQGNYTIRINVSDTGGNSAYRDFTVQLLGNNPVIWNATMVNTFAIYENNRTYLNFSQNVSDADGDSITFSFSNTTAFPSFNIDGSTGIINFTSGDEDVGYHNVTINATDGKINSLKSFNFTVYNINDVPYIENPILQANVINATVDSSSNIACTEDNVTTIYLWLQDNDFNILLGQKSFYNESLTVNLTIQGVNSSLFSFVVDPTWNPAIGNRTKYNAIFTPHKSDIGSYNITINVTDKSNASVILQFNLTVSQINHYPLLMNITNQTAVVNRTFYYRINATDEEDGSSFGNSNFTFKYSMLAGVNIFNLTTFNSTEGVFNITFNSSQGGSYHFNMTVNDSSGLENTKDFWIYVYDAPNITFPGLNSNFNLLENVSSNLTFSVNHSVQDNLSFKIYIGNSLKYNLSYYGNNTNFTWQYTPNFTEETYGLTNLTLIALNSIYPYINSSSIWNITINHTNAPVIFSSHMGDSQADYNNVININLSNYFSDIDHEDSYYNQTVNFTILSNSTNSSISSSVSNWTLTLSASSAITELITINAMDLNSLNSSLTSAVSNAFQIKFTTPVVTTTPIPSSGGGGGGGASKPLILKIITPEPLSAYSRDKISIPLTLINEGKSSLYDIDLTSLIAMNNTFAKNIDLSFDISHFDKLSVGEQKKVVLTAKINTQKPGLYEVTVNASVKDPKFSDWGKFYLTVKDVNKTDVLEKILFTEEFITENPECIEIKELIDVAKKYYTAQNYTAAMEKTEEALESCKNSISQASLPSLKINFGSELYKYMTFSVLIAFAMGVSYYVYRKIKFRRGLID
jgi:hypothetical protein